MYSPGSAALPVPGFVQVSVLHVPTPTRTSPLVIAVGVIDGRSSEYFDFFVFGIASVLVFPRFFSRLCRGLTAR